MIDYRLLVLEAFNPPSDKQHVDYRNHYIEVLVDLIERNIVGQAWLEQREDEYDEEIGEEGVVDGEEVNKIPDEVCVGG